MKLEEKKLKFEQKMGKAKMKTDLINVKVMLINLLKQLGLSWEEILGQIKDV